MKLLLCFLVLLSIHGCKEKEKDPESAYFPVVPFIKGQAVKVDSTLEAILKIEITDKDTTRQYIHRKDWRKYAADFMDLPDISQTKFAGDYDETKIFDSAMQRYIFTYTPKDEDLEIRRQDVIMIPSNEKGDTEVESIVIRRIKEEGDAQIDQTLVWYSGKKCTIISRIQKEKEFEKIKRVELIWNDFSD